MSNMKMKKEKMLQSMDLLDDKYIAEATPENRKIKRIWSRYGVLAACFCLVLSLGLFLFLPFNTDPPDVSMYSGSEYYSIIQKLNIVTFQKPLYKNNFSKIISRVFSAFVHKDTNAAGKSSTVDENYREITDNQVAGVIEADLIKRSDKYIYYLKGDTLEIYSINGEMSEMVGLYDLQNTTYTYSDKCEFYLSADCKTVTIVAQCSSNTGKACVGVVSLDVSDPANITEKHKAFITGSYLSSRMVDGNLLLISQFYVGSKPDFSEEKNFLPQIDDGNGMKSIPAGDIISPDTLDSSRYTILCKLDESTLGIKGSSAFLSYSNAVYVSANSVYATRTYTNQKDENGITITASMTEISRLLYAGEAFENKGSVNISGYVKDQYSLDEYKNTLRVVTTTSTNRNNDTNASLYCIDLDSLNVVSEVKDFAPKGEIVRSVRFDKQLAYVCTSVQLQFKDPVFFFDLSDLNNITCKKTGTIDGYSNSLVNFGNGYLLGIGVGSSSGTLKIEVYEESENGVVSVCKYEVLNVNYSTDYKSYYIDRENKLIGLGYTSYDANNYGDNGKYVLLKFDNYNLQELVNAPLNGDNSQKRAVLIDGYLYMFGDDGLAVQKLGQHKAD